MDANKTPSKPEAESPVKKVASPIASQRLNSAEKQRKHREAVAERRRAQEEDFKEQVANASNAKLEEAAERKKRADLAKATRASRENVKVEQSRSRYAWNKKRVQDAAAAKVKAALEKSEQHVAKTVEKAKAFNQRVEAAQRRKAEQEAAFKERAKEAYEKRYLKKGGAPDEPATPAKPETSEPAAAEPGETETDEAAQARAMLEKLRLRSPAERMADAEARRSAKKREIQQRAARHNIKSQQVQARTAWDRKKKEKDLRVQIAQKGEKAKGLVSTPVRAASASKHNKHVEKVHANNLAAEEERAQKLKKDIQERQTLAVARRLERLTPSPPKKSRKRDFDDYAEAELPSPEQQSKDRMQRAALRREAMLMERKTKAARHNLKTKEVATNKMWEDVSKSREARKELEQRLDMAAAKREAKLMLRQEKARVENEHKQFVSETSAKIEDANRINEAVSNKVDQLQAFARRSKMQKDKVAFASAQSQRVSERSILTKKLRASQKEYEQLKHENDMTEAELKRIELLRLRSLRAGRANAYKEDVARLHYDYAEAARANKMAELERRHSAAEERRESLRRSKGSDHAEEIESDSESSGDVEEAIVDFGRFLFNIALDM